MNVAGKSWRSKIGKSKEQTYRLQNITNNMAEALYVVDRSGVIIFVNPAAKNLFAITGGEILGKKIDTFIQVRETQDGSSIISPDTSSEAMKKRG